MGFFSKKKKAEHVSEEERLDEELRDDLSKAYDELIAGGGQAKESESEEQSEETVPQKTGDFEAELIKAKIAAFKEKKTEEALLELIKSIRTRQFFLPSVSNMKEPFENVNGEVKLKKGAVLNPALLTSPDKKTYLPIFTDEKSMTRKSPSGIMLSFPFAKCAEIVLDKKNPITALVINPFSENLPIEAAALGVILGSDVK